MKTITLFLLLAMAAMAQDVSTGAKKYNATTGTWVDAFPPGMRSRSVAFRSATPRPSSVRS